LPAVHGRGEDRQCGGAAALLQQLYRLDEVETTAQIRGLLKRKLGQKLFLNQWDDLLRVAGSPKFGRVTASSHISKPHALPKQNTPVKSFVA
jgi:TnpA family transposase